MKIEPHGEPIKPDMDPREECDFPGCACEAEPDELYCKHCLEVLRQRKTIKREL